MMNLKNATAEELKSYARDDLGFTLKAKVKIESMRAEIVEACLDQGIPIPQGEAQQASKPGRETKPGYVWINIAKSDKASGTKPVFVGHNGKKYLVPRGIDVEVPEFIVEILQHSVEDKVSQDGETGAVNIETVFSYPFSFAA